MSIPDIRGLSLFKGLISHSHNYRYPQTFRNKDVVILGAGASGWDIALDMSTSASNIYLSHENSQLKLKLPGHIKQLPSIKEIIDSETVLFRDGGIRRADALLFCTGYKYTFPFLSPSCEVTVDTKGKRIRSLYKHIFHTNFPSLVFIGIPAIVCPFPLISLQSRAVTAVFGGKSPLPTRELMEADIEKELLNRTAQGWPERHAHRFAEKQWDYNASIAELAGCENLSPVVRLLYEHSWRQRTFNTIGYRREDFCLVDENTWCHRSDKLD